MLTLRGYQEAALRELFIFWRNGGGNPLIVMATGLGKSVVIAFLVKQLLTDHPGMRVLITAPNRELIEQDIKELLAIWPDAPIGINCDGLGRRDTDAQILFALVNSIYRNPKVTGARDLIIVDESHFIPHHEQGMYRATIERLRELIPDLRVAGLTATPYRLDSGHLCEGEGHIFDGIVYEYGIAEGIRDGWLSPLSSKATYSTIDVSGVGKRGGEFITEQLEAAALRGDIVVRACNELAGYKGCRRAWLIYCVGVKHADMVRGELRARGIDCEMVLGETPSEERDRIIEDFRAGRLTALVSVNVLSYGFNVPHVDLIAMLRPTCSTGLYVQQVGRGTRKADGKKDCLVLDFAGNVRRHGPVDAAEINTDDRGRKKDEAPVKTCPSCREIVMLAAKECPCCGHVFPGRDISHKPIADTVEILASQRRRSDWLEVEDVHCSYHAKDPPSLRVSYQCGFESYHKWVCLEHQGWAGASFDTDGEFTPHRQLNEFALEHLDRWISKLGLYKCRRRSDGGGYAAVAHWRESSTGRPLNVRKRNLSIHPTGIKDFGDGRNGGDGFTYTPIDLVMAANDCDLDTAFKFLSDHTGWAGEQIVLVEATNVLRSAPKPAIEGTSEEPAPIAARAEEPTEAAEVAAEASKPAVPTDELDPYTRNIPGVVGDVLEWILATARRPNRVLALAAAIPLVGTLIGRRVAGPTMSATHLYTVAVAPTGAGKQHPIDCIGTLLVAAEAQEHLGSGRFMSASALCNFVTRKPLSLCCSDEIGSFLAKVTARGASGHEREISSVLRSLWGVSFTVHPMPEWASREAQQVHTPALSIFGTSTGDELFQALQGESIDNGLLSRFLVLNSRLRSKDTPPQLTKEVPPELADRCRGLYRWYGTDVELIDIKRPVEQLVTQLPWASKAAEKEYLEFARMIDDRIDQDPALRPFLTRAAETAIRLATIRAAGVGYQSAVVAVDDVYWGAGIAWLTGQQLYAGAQTAVPETERSRWIKRILDRIRAGNFKKKKVKVRYLQQRLGRYLKAKEIKEIVAEMIGLDLLRQEPDGTLAIVMEPADED